MCILSNIVLLERERNNPLFLRKAPTHDNSSRITKTIDAWPSNAVRIIVNDSAKAHSWLFPIPYIMYVYYTWSACATLALQTGSHQVLSWPWISYSSPHLSPPPHHQVLPSTSEIWDSHHNTLCALSHSLHWSMADIERREGEHM